jgi:ABC-type transport system involved in cytochrome bd biosynthesis fused ATPase/permease subunit
MAKYATHTVHDMRAAAVHCATRRGLRGGDALGDLIARVIGDTARIKANLKGFLVHITQNGILYLGVTSILLWVAPPLGLCFLAGALLTGWISVRTAAVVAGTARKQRRKEGAYAVAVHQAMEHGALHPTGDAINRSSAKKDVNMTKIVSRSSLLVHGTLAATVGLGLVIGIQDVKAGTLPPEDLFLFIAYVLTVHRHLVQVGRQMALSGKVLACVNRVGELLEEGAESPLVRTAAPLVSGLRLDGVRLESARGGGPRIRDLSLTIAPGSRTAVLGGPGDGKSSLLRILAGAESPDAGTIAWDDQPAPDAVLISRVGHLPQIPVFSRIRVWQLLGLPGPGDPAPEQMDLLEKIGAWKIIRRLPDGLNDKVGSPDLSPNEARALVLGAVLLGDAPVWVLDAPLDGIGRIRAQRRLDAILARAQGRTLVVGGIHTPDWERFDRVLSLRKGQCEFDGTPAAYQQGKNDPAPEA